MNHDGKFNWHALILGIILMIGGFIAFSHPAASLVSIAFIFGIMTIIRGIYQIYTQRKLSKSGVTERLNIKTGWLILVGIINLIFGIFILVNWQASIIALPIVFAVLFLAEAVAGLFTLPEYRKMDTRMFVMKLILNILYIIVGILLIANPFAAAFTIVFLVGFYFTLAGIEFIISAFNF